MVVGGLPASCEDHADKVANMACSMLDAVTQVYSPVDAQPIKVRRTNNDYLYYQFAATSLSPQLLSDNVHFFQHNIEV